MTSLCLLLLPIAFDCALPQGPAPSIEAPARAVARAVLVLPTGGLLSLQPALHAPIFGLQNASPKAPFLDLLNGTMDGHNQEGLRFLEPDTLVTLLRAATGSGTSDPALTIDVVGERLLASGPPDLVDLARRRLVALSEQVGRPIQLQAELYQLTEKTPPVPAVLGPEQLAEVARTLVPTWRTASSVRPGMRARLGLTREVRSVGGIGVEVAQKARIGDPLIETAHLGTAVLVEAHLLAGSPDLVLFAQMSHAELVGEIGSQATGATILPSIDTPILRSVCGGFSGRVPDGGGLAITIAGEGDFQRLLILRASSGAPARDLDKIATLPISALTSPALSRLVEGLEHFPVTDPGAPEGDPVAPIFELDVLRNVIASAFGANNVPTDLEFTNRFVAAPPDSDSAKKTQAMLRTLEDQLLRNTQLEVAIGQAQDLESARGRSAGTLPRSLRLPMLVGFQHPFIFGTEARALVDFEVEIAQEAVILSPVVVTTFRGITVMARALERGSGACGLEARLVVSNGGTPTRRPIEGLEGGELQRTDVERAVFTYQNPLPTSGVIECGDGPRLGTGERLGMSRPTLTLTELGRNTAR